jgi:ABC-type transport system substrate-binding protein
MYKIFISKFGNPFSVKLSVKRKTVLVISAVLLAALLISVMTGVRFSGAQAALAPTPQEVYPGLANFNKPVLSPYAADYHQPYLGKIVFEWTYSSEQAVYLAMTSGQGDIAAFSDPSIIQAAESNPNFNVTVVPTFGFRMIQFNFVKYPYNNTYFRRGIISLIDYNTIQSTICHGGLTCIASPDFLIQSSYPAFYSEQAHEWYLQHESYNLTRAMLYFEKAGLIYNQVKGTWYLPNGTVFQPTFLYWANRPDSQAFAELLQSAAAKINMTIKIIPESISTIISLTSIPYNQQTWDMLYLGWRYVSSIAPIQLEFLFGEQGYLDENASGFYNKTIFDILGEALQTSNYTQSVELTKIAQVYLMQQLPYVMISWNVVDTVVNIKDFANYVVAPGFGISTIDVHPVGSALTGTFYEPAQSTGAPSIMNIYSSTAAAEDDVIYPMYDTPFYTSISNPAQFLPWIATNWSVEPNLNITTPNGRLVNGEAITLNFARNVTFQDGVPLTAVDYNFTLWYLDEPGLTSGVYNVGGLLINYSVESQYSAGFWFGALPQLVYSQVNPNDPYQVTLYLNTSSYWAIYQINSFILPKHIFDKIPPQNLYEKKYINELGSGPYIWAGWSTSTNIAELVPNLAYWKFNPLILWSNVTQGEPYVVNVNVTTLEWDNSTDLFDTVPIYNATARMQIGYLSGKPAYFTNGQPAIVQMNKLSGNEFQGVLDTSMLSPGLYEVTINATYTAGGIMHEFLRFYSLTVSPAPVTTPTTTTTTTTQSTQTTTTTTSTQSTPTKSTSSPVPIIVGVVVVVVIIAIAVVLLRRR